MPHPPQFVGSAYVLVQVPPQIWFGQFDVHAPATQYGPADSGFVTQLFPQVPQLLGSVWALMQALSQNVVPAPQLHVPPLQIVRGAVH
jgi:hypothetical protein